ncbi:thiamine phosphate synthase [Helicobacter sp. MIT 11-5569]|uniref:thiamine phosphate synthase n=1 Tax=Helicobacter sp. MIT 11-5569 TaxID=1548151 RepID=UPI00051F9E1F|nr:thiamine phosphate synthase [Helicobacter sp. MIT 11-5569]TLD85369.1 thiamine phosphate synthase [Helicobacter sp. MIT 11-5569]
MLHGIYAISDTTLTPYSSLASMLKDAIKGGISLFQLRDKTTPDSKLASLCEPLIEMCKAHNVIFVLNDRIELAKAIKSPALHIGKKDDDTPYTKEELKQIRAQYSGILGVSCYGDFNLAQNAALIGADYVAFGACFQSSTKPNAKTINLDIFTQAQTLGIPLCAIGGIQKDNIKQIKGAQMVACISSIWQGEITKNVQELLENFKQG